ncbi:MAG: hypothetical protein K2H67_00360 [Treponemataceae bacterium]|nr:hypothetical protein [Treponemataceae bacterium]
MKTMTLDDVKRLPPLTAEEVAEVKNFKNTDFEDCPKQSKADLVQFRPWYELHRGLCNRTKTSEIMDRYFGTLDDSSAKVAMDAVEDSCGL